MYNTTYILRKIGIQDAYKVYFVLINDYDGLACKKDLCQMVNLFDNNDYDPLDHNYYDKFVSTLLEHEYQQDNVTEDMIDIINRKVI